MTIQPIQKAAIGRIVHVVGKAAESNGAAVAPAIITRVWGEPHAGGKQLVNLTVLPDNSLPKLLGSVCLFQTPEAAQDAVSGVTGTDQAAAYWPGRS